MDHLENSFVPEGQLLGLPLTWKSSYNLEWRPVWNIFFLPFHPSRNSLSPSWMPTGGALGFQSPMVFFRMSRAPTFKPAPSGTWHPSQSVAVAPPSMARMGDCHGDHLPQPWRRRLSGRRWRYQIWQTSLPKILPILVQSPLPILA